MAFFGAVAADCVNIVSEPGHMTLKLDTMTHDCSEGSHFEKDHVSNLGLHWIWKVGFVLFNRSLQIQIEVTFKQKFWATFAIFNVALNTFIKVSGTNWLTLVGKTKRNSVLEAATLQPMYSSHVHKHTYCCYISVYFVAVWSSFINKGFCVGNLFVLYSCIWYWIIGATKESVSPSTNHCAGMSACVCVYVFAFLLMYLLKEMQNKSMYFNVICSLNH